MKKILPTLISLSAIGFILSANPSSAQESPVPNPQPFPVITSPVAPSSPDVVSITAIPPRLELEGLPGATLQETLKVRNQSDTEMAFSIKISDFIVNNDKGTPLAVEEIVSGRWSLASWLTVSPTKIILPPKQTSALDLVVNIPDNALPGGHYAMVTYSPTNEGLIGQDKTGSAVEPKVGSLIYLSVIGDVTEAVYLKQFKSEIKFKQYGPMTLFAEIENLGDVHVRPSGNITITNLLGKTVITLPLKEHNIFPFASRTYDLAFPGKWHLGRYTATLTAFAGASQLPINGLIYFWIVPWKEMLIIIIALIVLIVIVSKMVRRKKPQPPVISPEDIPAENPQTTIKS